MASKFITRWDGKAPSNPGKRFARVVAHGTGLVALAAALTWFAPTAQAFEEPVKPGKKLEVKPVAAKPADEKPAEKPAAPVDPNAPQPKIAPDSEIHDFGQTWVGDVLQHTFKIKNDGKATLNIEKVQPGCGCTKAGTHPNKLEPGESGDFSFSLNSAKLNGPYEKMITITTNDPTNPNLKLKLKGEAKQFVNVAPTAANFGKIIGGDPQERVLKITNNTDKPLELTMEETPGSKFKFELVETEKGKAYDLKVTLAPPFDQANLNTQLKIKTNVEKQPSIDINAIATVPPRLELQPTEITVIDPAGPKGAQAGAGLTRLVRFNNYGATPVKITEANCDDPQVKVTIQERVVDKEYTVQVQMPAGYAPPDTGRTITLKTNDPQQPELKVPIKSPAKPAQRDNTPKLSPAEQMIGEMAPAFGFKLADGKAVTNADLANTVTVLDFWAPNCGFCKKQIPRIEPIRKEFESKGVRFIGVTQKMRKDFTQEEITKVFREDAGSGMELGLDLENQVGGLFKANAYPTMIILGKTGKIEAVNSGNIADLESKMTQQLTDLLAGKSLPKPEAKAAAATPEQPKPRPATEMVGKPAPAFASKTIDGKPVTNEELAKHPATILNFVAPNCGFCKKQVPVLEAIRKEYEAKGIRFVNVVQKMRKDYTQDEIVDVFKGVGSQLEMALDLENKIGQDFKAVSYPTMVIVDRSGKVDQVHIGAKQDLDKVLKQQLDNLIAGKSNAEVLVSPGANQPVDAKSPDAAKADAERAKREK